MDCIPGIACIIFIFHLEVVMMYNDGDPRTMICPLMNHYYYQLYTTSSVIDQTYEEYGSWSSTLDSAINKLLLLSRPDPESIR